MAKNLSSKNGYESMNRSSRPSLKLSMSVTQHFVGETRKITSVIAFLDVSCNGYCDQLKHNRARIQTLNHSWRGFKSVEQVLEEKAWLLRQQGKGKLNWWSMTINEKEKWKMTKKQKKKLEIKEIKRKKRVIFSLVYYSLVIMIFPVQFEINQYS